MIRRSLSANSEAVGTKTARFAAIVAECGAPELVSIWGEPNPAFLSAARQDRVMTIKQANTGTKRDFGIVGFLPEKSASYLLFPKRLTRFKDARVIGIKYDVIRGETNLAGTRAVRRAAARDRGRAAGRRRRP